MTNLGSLTSLSPYLEDLYCGYNMLSQLPDLPKSLRTLNCPHNRLRQLPKLPELTILDVTSNEIKRLRPPETLVKLYCSFNPYLQISTLPNTLRELHCCNNNLHTLILPCQIEIVYCSYNDLKSLVLPPGLKELICDHNQLTHLQLPDTLVVLDCIDNQLTSLTLPPNLHELSCSHNQLTTITLNSRLRHLIISSNPLLSVPVLPKGLVYLSLNHTQVENCFEFDEHLEWVSLCGTPLYTKIKSVLPTDRLDRTLIKLAFEIITMIEQRFRENYYGLKVKEPLFAWLWRSRETLARRKYHPDELWKQLEHGYDTLEMW